MKKKKKTKNKKPKKLSDHVNQLTHWTRLLFNTLTQSNSNSIFFPLGLNGEWYCECSLFRSSLIHFKLGLSNDAHTIVKNEITLSPTLSTFISTWHYEPITCFCLYEPIVYLSQSLSEGWPADEKARGLWVRDRLHWKKLFTRWPLFCVTLKRNKSLRRESLK